MSGDRFPNAIELGGRHLTICYQPVGEGTEASLSTPECALLERAKTPKRRAERLAGRIAARRACAPLIAHPFSVLVELDGPHRGRPRIEPASDVSVSISHAGGLACAAAARGGPLGVDLESLREPVGPAFRTEAFADGELEAWERAGQLSELELWAAKEAVLKHWGVGLRAPLLQVALVPRDIEKTPSGLLAEIEVRAGSLDGLPEPPSRVSLRLIRLQKNGLVLAIAV